MARKRKEVERKVLNKFHDFDNQQTVEGIVEDYREISTKFGAGMVLDLQPYNGEKISIMVTAGLKGFDWQDFQNRKAYVEIVAGGWEKTDNGRMRTFKVYELE